MINRRKRTERPRRLNYKEQRELAALPRKIEELEEEQKSIVPGSE